MEIYDTVFNAELGENINIRTQFGSDSGLAHFEAITTDGLNGNSKLITNRAYYYSVTAYGYNPDGIPKTLESSPRYLTVRPEVPNTVVVGDNTAAAGDVITTAHTGPSQGTVDVVVVDASQMTGDSYTVTMDDVMPDGTVAVNWTLTNDMTGVALITNNPVVGGVNTASGVNVGPGGTPVVEGIQILVNGPQEDLLSVEEYTAPWKDINELRDTSVSYLPPSLGRTGYILENIAGVAYDGATTASDFDRFNYWESDDVELDFSTPSVAWDYYWEWTAGMVPFSSYRHNFRTGEKEQMYSSYYDSNQNYTFEIDGSIWTGPIYGRASWEPVYAFVGLVATPYDPTKEAQYLAEDNLGVSGGCGWASFSTCDNTTTSGGSIAYPFLTSAFY
jgi:hypothetical protein